MIQQYIPQKYLIQIIATVVIVVLYPIIRALARKIVVVFSRKQQRAEDRTHRTTKIVFTSLNFTFILMLAFIWGVDTDNMLVAVSSVFAVIGVAMFAQWSMLSNITAGIIIFFSAPFRVGDKISILDKDTPIVAVIEDMLTFHTYLRTDEGELIVIPNSLFMQKVVSLHDSSRH